MNASGFLFFIVKVSGFPPALLRFSIKCCTTESCTKLVLTTRAAKALPGGPMSSPTPSPELPRGCGPCFRITMSAQFPLPWKGGKLPPKEARVFFFQLLWLHTKATFFVDVPADEQPTAADLKPLDVDSVEWTTGPSNQHFEQYGLSCLVRALDPYRRIDSVIQEWRMLMAMPGLGWVRNFTIQKELVEVKDLFTTVPGD
ncbi:hypothetical protein ACFL2M_01220 [Patescibacteria group bacterium]